MTARFTPLTVHGVLERPPLPILDMHEMVQFRGILDLEVFTVPLETPTGCLER